MNTHSKHAQKTRVSSRAFVRTVSYFLAGVGSAVAL